MHPSDVKSMTAADGTGLTVKPVLVAGGTSRVWLAIDDKMIVLSVGDAYTLARYLQAAAEALP
jgi:hypothetical protein